jgi:hypothetical protein
MVDAAQEGEDLEDEYFFGVLYMIENILLRDEI